jgi:hypothetical protein
MKTSGLRLALVLFAFTSASLWAGDPALFHSLSNVGLEEDTQVPLAPPVNLFNDFRSRLEAAIQSRKIPAISALYQTNGVDAEDLKSELARWQPMIAEDAKRVSLFGKDLSRLPPKAHDFWTAQARRLTEREVAYFIFVQSENGIRLTLPLVVDGDRLLIVPSDKKTGSSGIEPSGSTNGSQPTGSKTNRTSSAAGSIH